MKVPHPIPYQGSKRGIANHILKYIPLGVETLIEPFAGSAAVSLAVACQGKAQRFVINDANEPLIELWEQIINNPQGIAESYKELWLNQWGKERDFYDQIRMHFNQTQRVDFLLYLLARCVKAAVRYNSNGEFNQSPDNRRRGAQPSTMYSHIIGASKLLKGRTELTSKDYREILQHTCSEDLVYLDPPYQGVSDGRNRRYSQTLSYNNFVSSLEQLNANKVSFIVSYDGRTGTKRFGSALPESLQLTQIEIKAGKSSQATLLGRNEQTYESLYLSSALVERIAKPLSTLEAQSSLFAYSVEAKATAGIPQTSQGRGGQAA